MNNILVAYFSATGITAKVAKKLAEIAEADLFEIKPVVPYTEVDLDWRNKNSRSSIEMAEKSSRPEIAERLENMDDYDTIYLGFPIWWYIAPTIINTFLESYDMSEKDIILFATSGGSGFGHTIENFREWILKFAERELSNIYSLLNKYKDKMQEGLENLLLMY